MGPPTEPWGTPHPNGFVEDVKPFTRIDCEWHERYALNHSRTWPWTPRLARVLISSLWFVLQIARGKTITSSFKHAVSDTFIIMFSERAPLEIISMKVICEGAKRPTGGGGRSGAPQLSSLHKWSSTTIYAKFCQTSHHKLSSMTIICPALAVPNF